MTTHLYLDSGDPAHTRNLLAKQTLLAGQTTNPSLVAKHPAVQARLTAGEHFTPTEIDTFYRDVVQEIATLVSDSVSIEVYADTETTVAAMVEEGRIMNTWIPNAHIKLPTTSAGVAAAAQLVSEGVRVNMTLCFTQAQAAAVYSATQGAAVGQVLLSPFIGRWDDFGYDGMSSITNIQRMFAAGDGHVQILAASLRSREHLWACYQQQVDIITAPYALLRAWADDHFPMPPSDFVYESGLPPVPYEELDLTASWESFSLEHELVTNGVARFAADWNAMFAPASG